MDEEVVEAIVVDEEVAAVEDTEVVEYVDEG
jgi:hypothetical protein